MSVHVNRMARLDCGVPGNRQITTLQRLRDLVDATTDMPADSPVHLTSDDGFPQSVRYIDVVGPVT